jgi:outer membrane protein assembly factor BamB
MIGRTVAASILAGAVCVPVHAQWPQFRGAEGVGTSSAPDLPLTWGEGKNVRWKTAIHGRAWSSPVILGNQVWLTTATEDGRELFAVAVDRETGHSIGLRELAEPTSIASAYSYLSATIGFTLKARRAGK